MAHSDFLERTGVQRELQETLRKLVVIQPDDPISFMTKHFENLVKPTREPTLISSELLQGVDVLDPVQLDSTVYKTFMLLSDTDNTDDILTGRVQGVTVNKLIRELCCNLDPNVSDSLLGKLQVPPEAVLSYTSFKTIITTKLNLQAYLRMAKDVFESIDIRQTGSIRRQIGEDLLSRLSSKLSTAGIDSESAELARTSISSAEITSIIQRTTQREGTMSLEEFQKLAGQIFVNHLPISANRT